MDDSTDDKKKIEAAKTIIEECRSIFDNPTGEGISEGRKKEIDEKIAKIEGDYVSMATKLRETFKNKVFNDSIHYTIELNPVEIAVIQTPEFYRLRNIKQVGGGSQVYPGAVHTRFEHSIGVCHLAGEFVKHLRLKEPDVKITSEQELCVRLAGLCHDLGHGPFSHLFEKVKAKILGDEYMSRKEWKKTDMKETPLLFLEHEELSVLILKWILLQHMEVLITFVENGLTWEHVKMIANMIEPSDNYTKPSGLEFLFDIVANKESGLDVDKWDYFQRDCLHLGLTNEFDYRRTMKFSRIVKTSDGKKRVGFKEKEIHNIGRMFRTRCVLHQKACAHPVVKGVELMISDILFKVKDVPMFTVRRQQEYSMESLTKILKDSVTTDDAQTVKQDLTGFILLTDSILDIIQNINEEQCPEDLKEDLHEAHRLLERIMKRDIYWSCHDKFISCTSQEDVVDADKTKKEYDEKFNEDGNDFKTEAAKISYASELGQDPIKDVLFYEEEVSLPDGYKIKPKKLKMLPKINIPKTYTEMWLRVYYKGTSNRKEIEAKVEKIKQGLSDDCHAASTSAPANTE